MIHVMYAIVSNEICVLVCSVFTVEIHCVKHVNVDPLQCHMQKMLEL